MDDLMKMVLAPYEAPPADLTTKDVEAVAGAIAETMRRLEAGKLHPSGLLDDLWYSINPWASEPANAFLRKLAERYERLGPLGGEWGRD